jgi:hypothetical protein
MPNKNIIRSIALFMIIFSITTFARAKDEAASTLLPASARADDAAFKKQLVGSWKGPDAQTIVVKQSGVMTSSDNPTPEKWDVRDGVFHTFSEDKDGGKTGENFFKIISLTETKFVIQDMYHGRHTGTWTRSAASK